MDTLQHIVRLNPALAVVEVRRYPEGKHTRTEVLLSDGWTAVYTSNRQDGVRRIQYRRTATSRPSPVALTITPALQEVGNNA